MITELIEPGMGDASVLGDQQPDTVTAQTAHRQPALIATTYVDVLWDGTVAIDS